MYLQRLLSLLLKAQGIPKIQPDTNSVSLGFHKDTALLSAWTELGLEEEG